jgi:hypothetical protein
MIRFLLVFLFASCFAGATPPTTTVKFTQLAPINLTAAGTAQAISATDVLATCIYINALAANTGVIYVGDSAVTSANGLVLQKGDSIEICAEDYARGQKVNLKNIYFDGGTTNDDIKVSYTSGAVLHYTSKAL